MHRIFEGVTDGVSNRANVIINFQDGYYSGSSLLDRFAILQATHGNLGPEQSFGFVMSTDKVAAICAQRGLVGVNWLTEVN